MHIAVLLIFLLVSCLVLWAGYIVRYRQKLELLVGYDAEATTDKPGLARWAGTNLMVMASLQAVCGIAGFLTEQMVWSALAFAAGSLLVIIIMALGTADYSKKSI